jgi:DNA-binding NtrC family response regulator
MSKGTILIVEPDEAIREVLAIYLKQQGYNTRPIEEASKFLSNTNSENFDLMIYGFGSFEERSKELISFCEQRNIPCLLLFQKPTIEIWGEPEILPPDNELTKPFDIEEMKLRVERLLGKEKS